MVGGKPLNGYRGKRGKVRSVLANSVEDGFEGRR